MLTSLLSIYIASALQGDLKENPKEPQTSSIIKTASLNFSNILESSKAPLKDPYYISPIIEAEASIAIDLNTGEILFEKNIHARLAIASITKLMTILIILEENKLDEVVTISSNAASTNGSTMHLKQSEEITVENLLYGAIINSANDAAVALAEHNSGSVSAFVEKMNQKAKNLGLINSNFSNPIGLDGPNNYSSAFDVAKIAKEVYQYEFIQQAAQIKDFSVSSVSGKYTHSLESTNELLDSYLGIKGLKTGKTDAAGLCFVAVAENEEGNEIITVVLNSPARFPETKILVDWIFRAYNWPQ